MNEPPTVDKLRVDLSRFGAYDYVVFVGVLLGCVSMGVYGSCRERKGVDCAREYLMGGRRMSCFPVAVSLVLSFASDVTLLGIPTEIYLHGTEWTFSFIPIFLTGLVSCLFFPVFHDMQLSSAYEYLERRFDRSVRLFGSLLFIVAQMFWLPTVVYAPALAFNQVTGVNIYVVTSFVCVIAIFYTCLGGLKTVVWTDAVLASLLVVSLVLVCLKGSVDSGGFEKVLRRNQEGGRLVIPSFEGDLTIRHTFWSLTCGGLILWIQESIINQNMLQKYLSVPSLSHSRKALWIFVFGAVGFILLCSYAGLVIYAFYHDCDPLATKLAKAKDQLLPLLVMRILTDFPGLTGLFMAGIFSPSFSSLSTGLISMSAVVLEDFINPYMKKGLGSRATAFIMRGTVLFFGILFLIFVLIAEKLGAVMQLSSSLPSVASGPVFGVFFSGMFLPWVNAKGALLGGFLGLFASGFVIIGAQNAAARNKLKFFPKPTSVEGCLYYYNATAILMSSSEDAADSGAVFPLFKLSYFWYAAFGAFITVILALIISAFTGFTDVRTVDPVCFSPVVRRRLLLAQNFNREKLLLRELKNRG